MKWRSLAEPSLQAVPKVVLQRKCACGQHAQGECEGCRRTRQTLQRQQATGMGPASAPDIVHEVLRSPGRPLSPAIRASMEPLFGHDFSRVRVHTDGPAAHSAEAVSALAYTVGRNIVFGAGLYAPETSTGKYLLAHELSHVVQQQGQAVPADLKIGPPRDPAEQEAEASAQSVVSEAAAPIADRQGKIQLRRFPGLLEDLYSLASEGWDSGWGEEEASPEEVHDGDSPVSAEEGRGSLVESFGDLLLAFAGEESAIDLAAGEPIQEDSSKAKKAAPDKPAPPKPKPRKITHILVDQASQKMTLTWNDGTKDAPVDVSTGKGRPGTDDDPCKTQKEKNCTPNGSFKVGSLGNKDTKNSHGDAMAWYVGFVDSRGIGIHNSQPVSSGTPLSHGCVRVGKGKQAEEFAKLINKSVIPGTTVVEVKGKAPTKPYGSKPKKKEAPKKPAPKPAGKKK